MKELAILLILIVGGITTIMLPLLMYRNNWIYKKRLKFIHNAADKLKQEREAAIDNGLLNNELCVSLLVKIVLWTYDRSLLSFWIWDFSKMVKDKDLYAKYSGDMK